VRGPVRDILICALLLVVTGLSLASLPPQRAADASTRGQATATLLPTEPPTRAPTALPTSTPTEAPTRVQSRATPTPFPTARPTLAPTATPFLFDTHPELDRFVYVDQVTQRMWVFQDGLLIRDIPCSTGLPTDTTYTEAWSGPVGRYWGTFFAFDVFADEAWYLYPSLGSILVHSLPYVMRNGYKVYLDRDALGVRPASHGCIRISPEDAAWFTAWNPEGVLMTINDPHLEMWSDRLGY